MIDNLDDFFLDQPVPSHEEGSRSSNRIKLDSFLTYLPRSQNGSVIITTRSKEVALKLVYERDIILVEPMDQAHALALIKKKLLIPAKEEDAQRLVEKLDYMPLAIAQAVAYLNKRAERSSVTQYLEDFEKNDRKRIKLLQTEPSNPLRDYEAENTIMDTWQISFNHVQRTRPSAAAILSRASFCDRQGIPEILLRTRPEPGEDTDSISSDDFEDDLQILRDFLFISQNADGRTFEMHRLVQLATRNWLRAHREFEDCQAQFLKGFAMYLPSYPLRFWATCGILLPHAQAAYMQRPTMGDALVDWSDILYLAYQYLVEQEADREALKMIQAAYNARKAVLGPNHLDTLICRIMMGSSHGGRLGLEEEETILEEVVECAANFYGPESPEAIWTMPYLAGAYLNKDRFSDAETVLRNVLEFETKLSSIMWIDTGSWYRETRERSSRIAQRNEDQAKVPQAKSFGDSRVLLLVEASDYDKSIFNAKLTLARLYSGQNRWKEAEDLYCQAVSNELLEPLSTERPFIMKTLAEVYLKQRKWKEAESVFQQSLDLDMEISGSGYDHSLSFQYMEKLTSEYCKSGMLLEAEVFQRYWLEKLQKVLGNEHSGTMKMMVQLAVIYNEQGRDLEARGLVFQVLGGCEMTKDTGHLDGIYFLNLMIICVKQDLWKEAEVAGAKAIEEWKRRFGPDHEKVKELRKTFRLWLPTFDVGSQGHGGEGV